MLGTSMKLSFVAAEVNLTSQGTFSFADMTVSTLMPPIKRLYAPFTAMITAHSNNFLWSSVFLLSIYSLSEKMCTFAHVIYYYCDENKDNNLGLNPFVDSALNFFLFKSFTGQ